MKDMTERLPSEGDNRKHLVEKIKVMREQYSPLEESQAGVQELLDFADLLDNFFISVSKQFNQNKNLKNLAVEYYRNQRQSIRVEKAQRVDVNLSRQIAAGEAPLVPEDQWSAGKYELPQVTEEAIRQQEHQRNRLIAFIAEEHPNIFARARQLVGEKNAAQLVSAIVDAVATEAALSSKAQELRASFRGLFLEGVGHNITEEVRLRGKDIILSELLEIQSGRQLPETSGLEAELQESALGLEVELATLRTDPDVRKLEFRTWLAKRKEAGGKIASSVEDRRILARIKKMRKRTNGLAGVLLAGPPGTGKTEMLIEEAHEAGFEANVTSMHRHSGAVQLMGEAPIPVTLGTETSELQKLTLIRNWISSSSDPELTATFSGFSHEDLLVRAPGVAKRVNNGEDLSQLATELREELQVYLSREIGREMLGKSEDKTQGTGWIDGILGRDTKQKRRTILDETDKAPSHAFDSMSHALSAAAGSELPLGNTTLKLPYWSTVDATCNALTIPEHIYDRYAPNILTLDYPALPDDRLRKLAYWLADEEGNISLPFHEELALVSVFLYLVPEIHRLYREAKLKQEQMQKQYPDRIIPSEMAPFSMRGMSKFVQAVRNGLSVRDAVAEFMLEDNVLAKTSAQLEKVRAAVKPFDELLAPSFDRKRKEVSQLDRILNSPLYALFKGEDWVENGFSEINTVELTTEQLSRLNQAEAEEVIKKRNILTLPNGIAISIEGEENSRRLVHSWEGQVLLSVAIDMELEEPSLISSNREGTAVVFSSGRNLFVMNPTNGSVTEPQRLGIIQPGTEYTFLGGTNYLALSSPGSVRILNTASMGSGSHEIRFFLDNTEVQASRLTSNENGSVVLIESLTGEQTYIVDLSREQSLGRNNISLQTSIRGVGWKQKQNLIFNPQVTTAYHLEH